MDYGSIEDNNLSLLQERLKANIHNEVQRYLLLDNTLQCQHPAAFDFGFVESNFWSPEPSIEDSARMCLSLCSLKVSSNVSMLGTEWNELARAAQSDGGKGSDAYLELGAA